jgi:hypothetical protein
MRSIIIRIATDNATFHEDGGAEVARILRELADRLAERGLRECASPLRDINGNTVGTVRIA